MNSNSLIQPLFDGPIDIVGDVRGEIDALLSLMGHLGYESDGAHPDGRRLVFVGDLTDRGPDSPAVVDVVQRLIESGRAQCVLGNHGFNILVDHRKPENKWFWGEEFLDEDGSVVPQVLADDSTRRRVRDFLHTLPLALERNDLRVVHACWDDEMIDLAKDATDVISLYEHHAALIDSELANNNYDDIKIGLIHQNRNPVKLLLSGPEERTDEPIEAGGKVRNERRVLWWNEREYAFCVFGHYSIRDGKPRSNGSAFCIDFGVGNRWTERLEGKTGGFSWKLAAMRFPERVVVFDDGRKPRCVMAKILTDDDLPEIKEAIATFQNGLDAHLKDGKRIGNFRGREPLEHVLGEPRLLGGREGPAASKYDPAYLPMAQFSYALVDALVDMWKKLRDYSTADERTLLYGSMQRVTHLIDGYTDNVNERMTVVHADLQTNQVTIQGLAEEFSLEPHLVQMVNALVVAKRDGELSVKGPEMQDLPGCKGKNISREIKNLKAKVPPLDAIIKSNTFDGYWLNK